MNQALCYCGNVHPGATLDEVLENLATGPAQVRRVLGASTLSYGLWLSQKALAESIADDHVRLRQQLTTNKLEVWTMNTFPYGDFHAEVTKYQVYSPNWLSAERMDYTLECARLLALLLPADRDEGTLSTLPLGYRTDFAEPKDINEACDALCKTALALAQLASESGKSIRLCLEPEPGCALENGTDFVAFWTGPLARAAERFQAQDAITRHLGLCLDTCHHALAFENPTALLTMLANANVPIGKIQLSSAIRLDPRDASAWQAMQELDEPRYLHQVRSKDLDGTLAGCDDIGQAKTLTKSPEWRVHFHVPIYEQAFGPLQTTQDFMNDVLKAVPALAKPPHLEVETYTWHVLPMAMRPTSDNTLAECIAAELRYAKERLS